MTPEDLAIAEDQLRVVLDKLGPTEADVAQSLIKLGIKGTHSALSCPVANYLRRQGQGTPYVNSYSSSIVDVVPDAPSIVRILNSGPIRDFVHNFDSGRYPELEQDIRHA